MKSITLILFLGLTPFMYGQNFSEILQVPPFEGVYDGDVAFADVDNDGDQDVLITGAVGGFASTTFVTKLYLNNGLGGYIEVLNTPFEGVAFSAVAFADIDGDSDQDVFITGVLNQTTTIAKLYTNNGAGDFTEVTGTTFFGVSNGDVAFSDIDDDNDQDLLIAGLGYPRLYTNDGLGNFTEVNNTNFLEARSSPAIAFADVDGDSDQDVLISGDESGSSGTKNARLYLNDGAGNFTEKMGTPFDGVTIGSIDFADVDGDNDQDVLITGSTDQDRSSILYRNDGSGNFDVMNWSTFEDVLFSSADFADIDGDGDQDVLITGSDEQSNRVAKLYVNNDGNGSYIEVENTEFDAVTFGTVNFTDVDNDGDQDVLITGVHGFFGESELYTNDGTGHFIPFNGTPFLGVTNGAVTIADIYADNDLDLILAGETEDGPFTRFYINNGTWRFLEARWGMPFEGISDGTVDFIDIDSDNDLDVFLSGESDSGPIAKLYLNDGSDNFTESNGAPLEGVSNSAVAFADVDGDNDLDVLLTGIDTSMTIVSKLFTYTGIGNFTETNENVFVGVTDGSVAFTDIDGDDFQDAFIAGESDSGPITKFYLNDGVGNFVEGNSTIFTGVSQGSIAISDIDGDNDQDIFITGESDMGLTTQLYKNDGVGNFTVVTQTPFEGITTSSVMFFDVDGDNDQDILMAGAGNTSLISKLYTNEGTGNFIEVPGTPFVGVSNASVSFFDVDGDNDEDVLITGVDSTSSRTSKLYVNNGPLPNNINELTKASEIRLYPNPTSDLVQIGYSSVYTGSVVISLYDLSGRLVSQKLAFVSEGEEQISMPVSSFSNGTYIVELNANGKKNLAKLVIN